VSSHPDGYKIQGILHLNTINEMQVYYETRYIDARLLFLNRFWGVIFVQPILYNFCDNYFSPLFIGQKQWREKEEERK